MRCADHAPLGEGWLGHHAKCENEQELLRHKSSFAARFVIHVVRLTPRWREFTRGHFGFCFEIFVEEKTTKSTHGLFALLGLELEAGEHFLAQRDGDLSLTRTPLNLFFLRRIGHGSYKIIRILSCQLLSYLD